MKLPMFIVRWIGNRVISKAQDGKYDKRDVGDGRGSVFFWRHRVFRSKYFAVFLHEFVRGDGDRCLHTHPWLFVTLILRRGYWEELKNGKVWRPVGYLGVHAPSYSHRVDVEPGEKPWSIVVVGPKVQEWGFHTVHGFRKWEPGQPSPICESWEPRGDLTKDEIAEYRKRHRFDSPHTS